MASYFAKMSFFKNQQKDIGCPKIKNVVLPAILGIALYIQNKFFTGHSVKLNFGQKIIICGFHKNKRLFWCITCTGLIKIVGDTVLWKAWKNRFFRFSLATLIDS